MPRMRVLFVNTATVPPLGADTWVHAQIMRMLDRSSHDLIVACATGPTGSPTPTYDAIRQIDDLRIVPVDLGPELHGRSRIGKLRGLIATLPAVTSLVRLAWLIRRNRVQVVHTSDRPRDAFACVLLSKLTSARCIVHVHVAYDPTWMGGMLRWSIGHADELVAVSQFVADSLVAAGHDQKRVHVVRNGIDIDRWRPGVGRDIGRNEFGFGDGTIVFLTVCRLFPEKGPAELIRAIARVRDDVPDIHLLVVGAEMKPGFLAELIGLTTELDLDQHVTFTGRRPDIPILMAAADVYAMPSFDEPFGLVFAEAMAMRLPVVALANGGTVEVVEHGRTGLLSAAGDAEGLADDLIRLARDPALRDSMGDAGRRLVEQRFTTRQMAAEMASVYSLVASNR